MECCSTVCFRRPVCVLVIRRIGFGARALVRSAYVLIEAADGYQVVLSIAEVFPQLGGHGVLLADRRTVSRSRRRPVRISSW